MSFRTCSDVPGISPMYKVSFCEESDTVIRLHAEVLTSTRGLLVFSAISDGTQS